MRKAILDARKNVDDMDPQEHVCTGIDDSMYWFAVLADTQDDTIYSDLPGCFPVPSYSGNNYIFVAYIYKINAIILWFMKNRTDECMIKAFKEVYDYLKQKISAPSCMF